MKNKSRDISGIPIPENGLFNNFGYLIGKIKKYFPMLFPLIVIGIITNSMMQYLWNFISKFVIDIVQAQATSDDRSIAPLLRVLAIVTAIQLVAMLLNTFTDNRRNYLMTFVRMNIITERVDKSLSMRYQQLEQPDILDLHDKALEATGGDTVGVQGLIVSGYQICVQVLLMLAAIIAVSALDPRLLVFIGIISIIQYLFFRYTVKKDRREVWNVLPPIRRKNRYLENTTQNFDYAKDIRIFGMKDWLSQKQHSVLEQRSALYIHGRNLWIRNSYFAHTCFGIMLASVYGVLIYTFLKDSLTIGDFTLYLGMCMTFRGAINGFLISIGRCKECSLQVDDFRAFMNLPAENEDDCIPIPEASSYSFEFRNVSYKYKGASGYAIENLNLSLEWGTKLAIVGLNGAGKTTFIKLLCRLYEPTEGEILLNGADIRRFRRSDYFKLFSPVFQNVEVFAFPIHENISMLPPNQTDKELSTRCSVASGLSEKLKTLTNGADTELLKVIHDDGVDLSGGEKQKLALARALYKDAPIIVLDEPTAALDALAEYQLYTRFNSIIGEKTAVYISHRLSSTRFCDSILMFKDGSVVEAGTHDELLALGGEYAEMFEVQSQYYKEEAHE